MSVIKVDYGEISGKERSTALYTENFSSGKTINAGKEYTFTLPTGAEAYDVWIGVTNATISGTTVTGWGRLTKEQAQSTGSNIAYRSYAGANFSTRDWKINIVFNNDNTLTISNTGTVNFTFKPIYIYYYE